MMMKRTSSYWTILSIKLTVAQSVNTLSNGNDFYHDDGDSGSE